MKIINFHEHVADDLIERNKRLGISVSVLLSVGAEDEARGIKLSEEHPDSFIPFAWLGDLKDIPKDISRLENLVKKGKVRGIKFQPLIQHFFPEEKRLYPIYELCQRMSLPILFHCGIVTFYSEFGIPHIERYGCPVFGIDEIAYEFPELPLVIAHMGGNYHYEALAVAEKHSNIYLDTAYLAFFCTRFLPYVKPIELIKRAVEFVGPERVLFGWEGTDPSNVLESDLTQAVKEKILWRNAATLLSIDNRDFVS